MIVDTDRSDDWRTPAAALLSTAPGPLRVPALVVTEVCYLLQVRLGPVTEAEFLMALSRQEFDLIPLTTRDYAWAAELVRKYSDLPLGAVDASVIAIAERLGDRDVATTDRRHFYAVAEARGFTLHPAVQGPQTPSRGERDARTVLNREQCGRRHGLPSDQAASGRTTTRGLGDDSMRSAGRQSRRHHHPAPLRSLGRLRRPRSRQHHRLSHACTDFAGWN